MNRLKLGMIVLAACGIVMSNGVQAKDSATSKATSGRIEKTRDTFVNNTEKQMDQWEERVSQLKKNRDAHSKDSAPYRDLEAKVNAMEAKIKEGRANLKDLKSASLETWSSYEVKVNANIDELKRISQSVKAE